jgi:thiamine biosynthesis protein ThiS
MKLLLNNKDTEFQDIDQLNIQELLEKLDCTSTSCIVKINGKFIKKEAYLQTFVRNGDEVIAIPLVGGG